MATYIPAIHIPTVVTTSNKWIDFKVGATKHTAAIALSTYTNAWTLTSAILSAVSADAPTLALTRTFVLGSDGAYRTVYTGTTAFQFLFSTGDHAATSARTIMGFSSTDTTTATAVTSTYQAPCMWIPGRAPAYDSYDRRKHVGGEGRETLSHAYYKRLTIGKPRHRRVAFELLAPEVTLTKSATSTDTNRAFETIWQTIIGGQSFQYFPDYTVSTSSGTYYLTKPDNLDDINRPHKDAEYYNFELDMMRKE